MKLIDLNEMTMRVGSYEQLERYLNNFKKFAIPNNHVGDIDQYRVYKQVEDGITNYVIEYDDRPITLEKGKKVDPNHIVNEIVAYFQLKDNEITTAFVNKDHRKDGLFSRFLFFLKQNEGLSQIVLGDLQSEEMIEAVKRIVKRFKASWIKDDEKIPYKENSIDQYYSTEKRTGWKIMLENDGDFTDRPKYWSLDLGTMYEPLLDYEGPK